MTTSYWKHLKRTLVVLSALIGVIIPIYCFYVISHLDIKSEPLSTFGVLSKTKWLWLTFIQVITLFIYVNNHTAIKCIESYINVMQLKMLKTINVITTLSLSLTGFIDMSFGKPHLIFAISFFVSYTTFIFWWGAFNIKYNLKNAIFSMGMGYGVFEVFFIVAVIIWNIKIH